VRKGAEKLMKHLNARQQGRLDGFFKPKEKEDAAPPKGKGKGKEDTKGTKRKVSHALPSPVSADVFFYRLMIKRERQVKKRRSDSDHLGLSTSCCPLFL
jgi:hypothetical protein